MADDPQSIYENTTGTTAGMRVSVRAATFSRGGAPASAVTLVVATTSGFFTPLPDDAGAATALLNSAEARSLAGRLVEAADAADAAAPGLLD
jgi:hypothetical protein